MNPLPTLLHRIPAALALVAGLAALRPAPTPAATLPVGYSETLIASGIAGPTAMEFAPDGRLFVCQQAGELRVIENGALLAAPFVTLDVDGNGERGLLGIAFDPGFATNRYLYVYYTATLPAAHNRVSRFTANGNVAAAGSETVILELDTLNPAAIHNGGAIHFGADDKLYIAVGENGNAPLAQTRTNLFGKVLRINADGSMPADNPFYNTETGNNRAIWALGFRNPFTFAVQPGTGRIFINDVGNSAWEEINELARGANYGWPNCEGACAPANPAFRDPIFYYPHGGGNTNGNSIAGGAFYNPATNQFPMTEVGAYFFADFVNGWIRKLDPNNGNQVTGFATGIANPVDLKVGADGRLYYLARGNGRVMAIFSTNTAPQITLPPEEQLVKVGETAVFAVSASGAEPLSYQWQRDGVNVGGATGSTHSFVADTGDDGASFRCVVTNLYGSATSTAALLLLTTNSAPAGLITAPTAGVSYAAGDTINYSGTGADPEDGALGPAAFSWTIAFHHDTHEHPFLGPITGAAGGAFVIPNTGETATNVWYRIHLTVTDSGGRRHRSFADIHPRLVNLALDTTPPGLVVTLDGQPFTAPLNFGSVIGMTRAIGAPTPQTAGGRTYEFRQWSDDGEATHDIIAPAASQTFTAGFQVPAVLVPTDAAWRYLDDGSDQGTAWRAPAFNDSAWSLGLAPLGYGDGDERTVVSFGPNAANKYITTYFRHAFTVSDAAAFRSLRVRLLRDDGGAVYLNGIEVFRSNLPQGAINATTLALSTVPAGDESVNYYSTNVPLALLASGTNVLAVEIHQAAPDSSDISFNLELTGLGISGNLPPEVRLLAPANGASFGAGASVTLSAAAEDFDGTIAKVEYFAGTTLLGETLSAPHSFEWVDVPPGTHTLYARATDDQGATTTSSPAQISVGLVTLIAPGSVWKYLDNGTDQGTAWRGTNFNDAGWPAGPAELGYGDDADNRPEATVVSFGGNPSAKHITTYFRRVFSVPMASLITNLTVSLLRDDGGVVYLNGAEVFRSNMPNGPVGYQTPAAANTTSETAFFSTNVNSALLVSGANVVAVEIHQVNGTSSDISFDLALTGVQLAPPRLRIEPLNAGLARVSWPALHSTGLQLQFASNLAAPDWSPASGAVTTLNGTNYVTVSVTGTGRFYRLSTR